MELCLTSQVLVVLGERRQRPGPRKLRAVFFQNRPARPGSSPDLRSVIMAPSVALMQSMVGGGLGLAAAGLTRYGIVHGGYRRQMLPAAGGLGGALNALLPIGVYVGSAMAFKHAFALSEPFELALATGFAIRRFGVPFTFISLPLLIRETV